MEEELDQIFTKKHFKKIKGEDLLFETSTPLKVEMLLILQQEPSIDEDHFLKKIDEISEEISTLGHGDNWDENGRHWITPMIFKCKILKKMKKKSPF